MKWSCLMICMLRNGGRASQVKEATTKISILPISATELSAHRPTRANSVIVKSVNAPFCAAGSPSSPHSSGKMPLRPSLQPDSVDEGGQAPGDLKERPKQYRY